MAVDPSGLRIDYVGPPSGGGSLSDCCKPFAGMTPDQRSQIVQCMKNSYGGAPGIPNLDTIDYFLDVVANRCKGGGPSVPVCVRSQQGNGSIPQWPCKSPCDENTFGETFNPEPFRFQPIEPCGLVKGTPGSPDCPQRLTGTNGGSCSCSIVICKSASNNTEQSQCAVFYHELAHCSGYTHVAQTESGPQGGPPPSLDLIYKLGCCICNTLQGGPKNCGTVCGRVAR